jgi:hypothetical protein
MFTHDCDLVKKYCLVGFAVSEMLTRLISNTFSLSFYTTFFTLTHLLNLAAIVPA